MGTPSPQETSLAKDTVKAAKVIQVIETVTLEGAGTVDDPAYLNRQYWSLDGELLAIGLIRSG